MSHVIIGAGTLNSWHWDFLTWQTLLFYLILPVSCKMSFVIVSLKISFLSSLSQSLVKYFPWVHMKWIKYTVQFLIKAPLCIITFIFIVFIQNNNITASLQSYKLYMNNILSLTKSSLVIAETCKVVHVLN
jgi:hypothetical protein